MIIRTLDLNEVMHYNSVYKGLYSIWFRRYVVPKAKLISSKMFKGFKSDLRKKKSF